MRTPAQNPTGYNQTSILIRAANIQNSRFLLIHGTGDDNVHFQNSAELAKTLIKHNVQFDTMFYTNRDHSISGDNARPHLYNLITNYILKTNV